MLGIVDAINRPLKIPPRFIPYMEKHRIYELFYEIARQLVIKKPLDHVLYVKQCLKHAARSRDAPRIVLLSPLDFNRGILAEYLEMKLGVRIISLDDLEVSQSADDLVSSVRQILRKLYFEESGWLFIDFPRSKHEARALQSTGIHPTHVIEIIWTDSPRAASSSSYADTKHCCSMSESSLDTVKTKGPNDLHELRDLRKVYANVLIQIETAGRTYEELGDACITMIKRRKFSAPCYNFRIVLIGPRGSGRRSVAKYLSCKYNLVYIDFHYLLEQVRLQNNALGETLRCLDRWGMKINAVTKIKVLQSKLMSGECLKRGWVVFGYPAIAEDFHLLDLTATPPNKVIFINVDEMTCRDRLFSRRYNVGSGSEHRITDEDCYQKSDEELAIHSKDYKNKVEQDLDEYFMNLESLVKYAGESAIIVDGKVDGRNVEEKVESCLGWSPSAPPRIRKSKREIKPEDIEFDPDDPVYPKIYDGIRKAESALSLV